MSLEATKVIEHPDIFVHQTELMWNQLDYIIELRNHPDELIDYEMLDKNLIEFDMG